MPSNPNDIWSILQFMCRESFTDRETFTDCAKTKDVFATCNAHLRSGYVCHLNATRIAISETSKLRKKKPNQKTTGPAIVCKIFSQIMGSIDRRGCDHCVVTMELPTMRNSMENVDNSTPENLKFREPGFYDEVMDICFSMDLEAQHTSATVNSRERQTPAKSTKQNTPHETRNIIKRGTPQSTTVTPATPATPSSPGSTPESVKVHSPNEFTKHAISDYDWPECENLEKAMRDNPSLWRRLNHYVTDSLMKMINSREFNPFKLCLKQTNPHNPAQAGNNNRGAQHERDRHENAHDEDTQMFDEYLKALPGGEVFLRERKVISKSITIDGGIHASEVESTTEPSYLCCVAETSAFDEPNNGNNGLSKMFAYKPSPSIPEAEMATIYHILDNPNRDHLIPAGSSDKLLLMLLLTSKMRKDPKTKAFRNNIFVVTDIVSGVRKQSTKSKSSEQPAKYRVININSLCNSLILSFLGKLCCSSDRSVETFVFLFLLKGFGGCLMGNYVESSISRWQILEGYMNFHSEFHDMLKVETRTASVNDITDCVNVVLYNVDLEMFKKFTKKLCSRSGLNESGLEVHARNIMYNMFYWANVPHTRTQNVGYIMTFDCCAEDRERKNRSIWGYKHKAFQPRTGNAFKTPRVEMAEKICDVL